MTWLASAHKAPEDLVFCDHNGEGLNYRNVGEDFRLFALNWGSTV